MSNDILKNYQYNYFRTFEKDRSCVMETVINVLLIVIILVVVLAIGLKMFFPKNNKVAFGFFLQLNKNEKEALLLCKSIRKFGGKLSESKIFLFKYNDKKISNYVLDGLKKLNAEIFNVDVNKEMKNFPLASKVAAAKRAEEISLKKKINNLIWLDSDTIILDFPSEFILNNDESVAYVPVHHKLIGNNYDKRVDNFWKELFKRIAVDEGNLFEMETADGKDKIYPYFNAGHLSVNPRDKIFKKWYYNFIYNYRDNYFIKYYNRDFKYAIFFHQAILTATILSNYDKNEIKQLSKKYNYPLNLHEQINEENKALQMEDLITVRYDRYENYFIKKKWGKMIDIKNTLKLWIDMIINEGDRNE